MTSADAVLRGLAFVEASARSDFGAHAADYLLGAHRVATGFANTTVRHAAEALGEALAARWRRELLPASAGPSEVRLALGGAWSAHHAGVRSDAGSLAQLRAAAERLGVAGMCGFDPRAGPPPAGGGGSAHVYHVSRWGAWEHALITAFVCDRLSFNCGATYFDVLRWLPTLKATEPLLWSGPRGGVNGAAYATQLSAIAHVVYTLSDYDPRRALDPSLLPDEFTFLRRALRTAAHEMRLPEATGEVLDCLKTFGLAEDNDEEVAGAAIALRTWQNADGSWAAPMERAIGTAYHSSIVSMWGLRDGGSPRASENLEPIYAELVPVLRLWAASAPPLMARAAPSHLAPSPFVGGAGGGGGVEAPRDELLTRLAQSLRAAHDQRVGQAAGARADNLGDFLGDPATVGRVMSDPRLRAASEALFRDPAAMQAAAARLATAGGVEALMGQLQGYLAVAAGSGAGARVAGHAPRPPHDEL